MAKINIGITGHNGFLGTHLKNQLNFKYDTYQIIPFERSYFETPNKLQQFVRQCDIIIHLAGLNRHHSSEVIYDTNLALSLKLNEALVATAFDGQLIFASSLHETQNTPYGRSKKEANRIFANTAEKANYSYTGLIIPNIFGPFGKPYYNSFITTFCDCLIQNKAPAIQDNFVDLIYVDAVIETIIHAFGVEGIQIKKIPHEISISVKEVWDLLYNYKQTYYEKGEVPNLSHGFELSLFNTFRSAIVLDFYFPRPYKTHSDDRGYFVELIREISGGQTSFSVTRPGVTRGNHFHTRKVERFSVLQGEAEICIRKIGNDEVKKFYLNGDCPAYVDMPIWHTHNITNIGNVDLITVFWINEPYNSEDADTYMEKV